MRGRPAKEGASYIPLMSVSEAASKYGVSRNNLSDHLRAGRILGYVVKGHVFVSAASIAEYKEDSTWARRGPNFTAVLEGHRDGKSDYAIAKDLGLTRERVRQIRSVAGLPVNPRRPTLPKMRAQ